MSEFELLLRQGMLVSSTEIHRADLGIADGMIVAEAPELSGNADEEIDCARFHIFPGVIDAHVHFNEPGRMAWEGFATGTRALAAGGTTTYIEMPLNAHPPTTDSASFRLKLAAAQSSSLVDFAFWGGLIPGNLEHLHELAEAGVVGFKAFMSASGIDDFPAVDDLLLYEGMVRAAQLGCLVAVHAENDAITSALATRAIMEGRTGIRDYLASRPIVAEVEAIERAILFAEETGCALHVVHVSTGKGVALVAAAQRRGLDVSCETCPHYLVFTEEDVEVIGALAKCAPPIRSAAERDQLWSYLAEGTLQMVASDHSPAPASMKSDPNFFKVWGGISGCQTLLQLLLTEGHFGHGLALTLITQVTSDYVARRFRFPQKGVLAVGADADLTLIDLNATATLQSQDLFYRHPHSPYVGYQLRGHVARTLLRGRTLYRDGKIVSDPIGRLITPTRVTSSTFGANH
jgi:allantoinase